MKQIYNPYLPLNKYIPDGEPHVFGDRVYIYGSQDREGGTQHCELSYETFSAALDDLKTWKSEGKIFKASQDGVGGKTRVYMYAPDVVRGNDGRYYLYYCMAGENGKHGSSQTISVAVCDTPNGKFEYHGVVQNEDGSDFLSYLPFDPGLINDDGKIFLYFGMGEVVSYINQGVLTPIFTAVASKKFDRPAKQIRDKKKAFFGAKCVQLENDMLTVKGEVKDILPSKSYVSQNDKIFGHAFFEASSMRKFGDTYYFIYSSELMHELCYATSKYPDKDFEYQGILISNGDVGLNGKEKKDRVTFVGNNHGSVEKIGSRYYVFYHRHTHHTSFSRQACAEEIFMDKNGHFSQVEITSCGLNDGALSGEGTYPAVICCHITGEKEFSHHKSKTQRKPTPHITHEENERFITDIIGGTVVGYKYFDLSQTASISIKIRGKAQGNIIVNDGEKDIGKIEISSSENWNNFKTNISSSETKPLYFRFDIKGKLDFIEFELLK
ncbi:MAG: family 43 glycosylhydrolase [Clostridia bacterium]